MDSISEDIVQILDECDGPLPKMRMKKRPTGAERMRKTDYDEIIPRSRDEIERVENHNRAYPSLRDELDKRRSLADAKHKYATLRRSRPNFDPKCRACMRLKAYLDLRRKSLRRPCRLMEKRRQSEKRLEKRQVREDADSNTKETSKDSVKTERMRENSGDLNIEKDKDLIKSHMRIDLPRKDASSQSDSLIKQSKGSQFEMKRSRTSNRGNSQNSKQSFNSDLKPNRTEPSVSSYRSLGSLGNEPMVKH